MLSIYTLIVEFYTKYEKKYFAHLMFAHNNIVFIFALSKWRGSSPDNDREVRAQINNGEVAQLVRALDS